MAQNIISTTSPAMTIMTLAAIAIVIGIPVGVFFAIKYLIRYHAKINEAVRRRAEKQ